LREARGMAEDNVARLHRYAERGIPVVGLEPSCITALRDDYRDLVPGATTTAVARNTHMIEDFLAEEWSGGRLQPESQFTKSSTPLQFHAHCQQRAVLGSAGSTAVLRWVADEMRVLDAGCCGMAGSFGYGHYDLSMTIGERRLFPAVREWHGTRQGATAAPGFSCRH